MTQSCDMIRMSKYLFLSCVVLQSAKLQYVILDKEDGSNTIKNIRRSDTLEHLLQEHLEK